MADTNRRAETTWVLHKQVLETIFERAKKEGRFLTPDAAMREHGEAVRLLVGPYPPSARSVAQVTGGRTMECVYWKLYHYAVSLCRKTYFPQHAKPGAPSLSEDRRQQVRDLRASGLSYTKIAEALGEPVGTRLHKLQSRDRIRKQVKTAKKAAPSRRTAE